ncbi:cytochrome P450 [Streptomyces sp. AC550_RSS872]|uniref:cytochrome P450 n=1 Tax=Streptomyces sp. AC550_RSS872 TaxID=2823689 RepID=UPI001C252838|nr:cytochrome P450 [Streptomyces sp. AC550_RSS872]
MPTSPPDAEPQLAKILASADRDTRYGELAAQTPVTRGSYTGDVEVWLITGHDEIVTVLNDPRFSSDLTGQDQIPLPGAGLPDDLRTALTSTLAAYDPPDHTRLRRLLSHAFTARRVQRLRPRVEHIVDALLADLPAHADADGTVDLMEHFAHQLPILVIGELLGLPPEDQQQWRTSAEGLTSGDPDRVTNDARNLIAYMRKEIAERRDPRYTADDLLTALARARDAGDRLTEDELVSTALSILLAGHRTTALLVRTMAVLVLTAALRPGAAAIPDLVEEILRRHGSAEIGTLRFAREPVELAGVTIERGDLVQVVLASGNRDRRRFTDPDAIDPARPDKAHLAFGHGIHYCLGAALARTMAEVALAALFRVAPRLTLHQDVSLQTTDPRSTALSVRMTTEQEDS